MHIDAPTEYWLYPSVPSRIDCHSTPLTLIPERRGRVAPGLKESRRKRTRMSDALTSSTGCHVTLSAEASITGLHSCPSTNSTLTSRNSNPRSVSRVNDGLLSDASGCQLERRHPCRRTQHGVPVSEVLSRGSSNWGHFVPRDKSCYGIMKNSTHRPLPPPHPHREGLRHKLLFLYRDTKLLSDDGNYTPKSRAPGLSNSESETPAIG